MRIASSSHPSSRRLPRGGKASKALLRQFCARGLLAVDDRRGDTCVDAAGTFAGCPPAGGDDAAPAGALCSQETSCVAPARTACARDGWWLEQSDERRAATCSGARRRLGAYRPRS